MQSKLFSLLALLQVVSANPLLARAPSCNRNNCFRQVAASSHAPFRASAAADCSKNLAATVTPCPVTTTTAGVATVTTTVTGVAPVNKRDVKIEARATTCSASTASRSPIPTYASSCANFAAYSSACSCNGDVGSATTLAPSTVTVTSQPTATQTVVPVHQIVSPNDNTALGYRDPIDSSLVIGNLRPSGYFYIDQSGLLREYQSNLFIVARDDSSEGAGVYQYFIGDPESGIIPQATVNGDKLALSVNSGTNTANQFCYKNDNGVLAEPATTACRFQNSVYAVNWVPAYAPYRGF